MNSRPLVPVSTDPENPFVLSPGTLLTQKHEVPDIMPELGVKDAFRSQWKYVQVLANTFWSRWKQEYIRTLQKRSKWTDEKINLKEGDVVILKEQKDNRNFWPLGIVERVFPSEDGLVRKLEVRVTKDNKVFRYIRPVTQVVSLICE